MARERTRTPVRDDQLALERLMVTTHTREVVCPGCAGPLSQTRQGPFQSWGPDECARCAEMTAAATREVEHARASAQALERLAPPYEYRHATLAGLVCHGSAAERALQQRLLARAQAFERQFRDDARSCPSLVVLYGGTGTGKTHIGWALAIHAAVTCGATARVWKFTAALRYLHGAWGAGDGDPTPEARRWEAFHQPAILVLDEVSPHAIQHRQFSATLYELLAVRAEHRRPTILTTNATVEELGRVLGAPLVSRIGEHDGFWDAGQRDYRLEVRAAAHRGGGR